MADYNLATVDLFCGIGGLTHGLVQAGIPVIAGFDIDETCKYAYEKNNDSRFIHKDITELSGQEVNELYPDGSIKILVGCAPCQPFSTHTQKNKNRDEDEKWRLLDSFSRLVREVQPDIVSAENVPAITQSVVFTNFTKELERLNYHISPNIVYCPEYGIPQSRKRLVLLASRFGPIDIIPATHSPNEYRTVREVIGELESLSAGEVSKKDPLHRSSGLNALNIKRIKQSLPGGTWRDWDKNLLADCHREETGRSYSGVYARMQFDTVGPTITTQFYNYGTGRFGHPKQDRALSLREGSLLQTFPPDYDFIDPESQFSMRRLGVHIGNAVPVRLGYVIGKSIIGHLEEVRNSGWQQTIHI